MAFVAAVSHSLTHIRCPLSRGTHNWDLLVTHTEIDGFVYFDRSRPCVSQHSSEMGAHECTLCLCHNHFLPYRTVLLYQIMLFSQLENQIHRIDSIPVAQISRPPLVRHLSRMCYRSFDVNWIGSRLSFPIAIGAFYRALHSLYTEMAISDETITRRRHHRQRANHFIFVSVLAPTT